MSIVDGVNFDFAYDDCPFVQNTRYQVSYSIALNEVDLCKDNTDSFATSGRKTMDIQSCFNGVNSYGK